MASGSGKVQSLFDVALCLQAKASRTSLPEDWNLPFVSELR